jgi:hypothetical protein
MRKLSLVQFFSLAIVLGIAARGAAGAVGAGSKYQTLVVDRFTIQEGVAFPADYLATMQEEILTHLQKSGRFTEVLRKGEKPSDPNAPVLVLSGSVIEFHPGSRAKRYVLGPGFGKTKVVAHIRFFDRADGHVVLEKNVDGKVIIGFIGGASSGATNGLAKEIAKDAKKKL